jgi:hypothetical protein
LLGHDFSPLRVPEALTRAIVTPETNLVSFETNGKAAAEKFVNKGGYGRLPHACLRP